MDRVALPQAYASDATHVNREVSFEEPSGLAEDVVMTVDGDRVVVSGLRADTQEPFSVTYRIVGGDR